MKKPLRLTTLAFLVACTGIATFSAMDVAMKGLALGLGAYNALLWRSVIATLLGGLLYFRRRPAWPSRPAMQLHIWRGTIIAMMAFLFFWGLKYLPVAEAVGLSFIAPLIALYLSVVMLREKLGWQSMLASLIGLAGALIVVGGRLSGDYDEQTGRGIAAILLSAVLYAYNLILQRQQALVARPVEIAFFQNCTLTVLFGSLAFFFAELPGLRLLPTLTAAAALGLVSLMMMSWAYARAPANLLLPVEYTAFAWAALFGWLVFAETVTVAAILGTLLIVIGCLVAAWQQQEVTEHVESTAA
jgi:S-adenosylmethionine uptake transporter